MAKKLRVSDFLAYLHSKAPTSTSEDWDNTGLLVGDPEWETETAVVSVDLTHEVLDRAIELGSRLIVNHHPCIFPKQKGLSKVVAGSPIFRAIREGVAVVAAHTNFDRCGLDAIEAITSGLGCTPKGRLMEGASGSLLKLVVFVPTPHVDPLREALSQAGAGRIGNYDQCTFRSSGEGTFRGDLGTNPFVGTPGTLERVEEEKFEILVPRALLSPVLKALHRVHPYEEPAYDLIPVEQAPTSRGMLWGQGYGFWGEFSLPLGWGEFADRVKKTFEVSTFLHTPRMVRRDQKIRTVAWSPGKGNSFLGAVRDLRVDAYVMGEVGYHPALDAARIGTEIIELGHRHSELFFARTLEKWLKEAGLPGSVEKVEAPLQQFV